jgi:hypothetical protein
MPVQDWLYFEMSNETFHSMRLFFTEHGAALDINEGQKLRQQLTAIL